MATAIDEALWDAFDDFTEKSDTITPLKEDNKCRSCKSPDLRQVESQLICGKCGLVNMKVLCEEAEYRFYGDADNKSSNPERIGMPTNDFYPESSLGTWIGTKRGKSASAKASFTLARYNSWNQMPHKERSLWIICNRISTVAKQNGLPTIIVERAREIFKRIKDVNISRGKNREGLIAACLWAACKDEGVPRSYKEIAAMFQVPIEIITKGISRFHQVWFMSGQNEDMDGLDKLNMSSSNPLHYIERFSSNLELNTELRFISEFVAIKAIGEDLVADNTAPSIAAGAIYLTSVIMNSNIQKKDVAVACLTSEVTISKCYKKLYSNRHKLFPKAIAKRIRDLKL